ncbi:MAG: hypothetical protein KAT43_06145 [Nanoarchaeota archaeon]|nr:hypothetical protein [Nanoarchaeota archaeon]
MKPNQEIDFQSLEILKTIGENKTKESIVYLPNGQKMTLSSNVTEESFNEAGKSVLTERNYYITCGCGRILKNNDNELEEHYVCYRCSGVGCCHKLCSQCNRFLCIACASKVFGKIACPECASDAKKEYLWSLVRGALLAFSRLFIIHDRSNNRPVS